MSAKPGANLRNIQNLLILILVGTAICSFGCDDQDGTVDRSDADLDGTPDGDSSGDADDHVDADPDQDEETERTCASGCFEGEICLTASDRCMTQWVEIAGGTFLMGSPAEEVGRQHDEIQHSVTLTRDFIIQTVEVTCEQMREMMSSTEECEYHCITDCPEMIDLNGAMEYLNALSNREGFEPCYLCSGGCEFDPKYSTPYECPGYRLPTEAEWEYAARAGTTTATYNGDLNNRYIHCEPNFVLDDIAVFCIDTFWPWAAVASRAPNPWGLYDMLGNVGEWVHDRYGAYTEDPVTDPFGPDKGGDHIYRGGTGTHEAMEIRAARRFTDNATDPTDNIGFRPVRTIHP